MIDQSLLTILYLCPLQRTDNGTDSQGKPLPKGPGYNFNTCEWIECATLYV